ncbi:MULTISPECIES: class I SAM-dependent methyltransferase [unclassified Candidatus Tisiphia]|uniref:class I SAM-dependent methyltransferase n=1 Tax=unclassified Candidatus Tisiphia TaxID=2996318 RepID=UPI001E7618C4|nr:MAG: class I SAM-dependent methyltransferase [Rickettsia endosymbiont of Cimex lectularius]
MSESKSLLKPNAWEAYYKEKFHKPAREFVVEFFKKVELVDNQKMRGTAIDLGAGVGHETFLLLEKGFNVIAIDKQKMAFDFMLIKYPEIVKYKDHFKTLISSFEELDSQELPNVDIIVASFSVPFCKPEYFKKFWSNIVNKIDSGGYFVGNTFDPEIVAFWKEDKKNMTFHTKEQTIDLFKEFNIISFKEVKITPKEDRKIDHYYEVIAKKK